MRLFRRVFKHRGSRISNLFIHITIASLTSFFFRDIPHSKITKRLRDVIYDM